MIRFHQYFVVLSLLHAKKKKKNDFTKFFHRKVKTMVSGIASTFAGEGVNLFRAKTYKLTTYKLTKLFFKWYMNV